MNAKTDLLARALETTNEPFSGPRIRPAAKVEMGTGCNPPRIRPAAKAEMGTGCNPP
ncbi:hypothetical protein LX81_02713, partial [Palleronia aestuarii]